MKKGVSKVVVFMIVAVVGAIILFAGTKLWAEQTKTGFGVETCRASVVMMSLSKTATGTPWLELECPYAQPKEVDKNNFKEELITSINTCWYQYGSGKVDFVTNYASYFKNENCFICSILTPKEKIVLTKEDLYIKNSNLIFNKDLTVTPDDPLYIMYGITKEHAWGLPHLISFLPSLLFYKPDARYLLLVNVKSDIRNVCNYIDPIDRPK